MNWQGLKKIVMNADLIIAGLSFAILVAITFIAVIFRYVFSKPISWVEELQLAASIWITFSAAGAAFRTGNHVSIDILVDILPNWIRRIVLSIVDIVYGVIIVFFMVQSTKYVQSFIASGRVSNILKLPYKYVYIIVPISCVLMLVGYYWTRYEELAGKKTNEQEVIDE